MKFRYDLRSLQIFNAFLLYFSRLVRNFPRPWVRHTHSSAKLSSLEKIHQKAKSSKSLKSHLNFITILTFSLCTFLSLFYPKIVLHPQ